MTDWRLIEAAAKIIYDAFPYDGADKKPAWVERGNSFMQQRARDAAEKVLALSSAQREGS